MNRFHVSITVSNLDKSVGFYTELFGRLPSVQRDDYAKWMLDDPYVNFSLSTHGDRAGIDHIGLQARDKEDLAVIRQRLERAEAPIFDQPEVNCCYAHSAKAWIRDPDGVAWETFYTHGNSTEYGDGSTESAARFADSASPG